MATMTRAAGLMAALLVASPAAAQWKTPNAPGATPTPLDLTAPAPRTADGKPDFGGLWSTGPVAGSIAPGGARLPFASLRRESPVRARTMLHSVFR